MKYIGKSKSAGRGVVFEIPDGAILLSYDGRIVRWLEIVEDKENETPKNFDVDEDFIPDKDEITAPKKVKTSKVKTVKKGKGKGKNSK